MNFASNYVYQYDHSDEESFEEDLDYQTQTQPSSSPQIKKKTDGSVPCPSTEKGRRARRQLRVRRADTNVVSVTFNSLVNASHMRAGEPLICQECGAIFSAIDSLTDNRTVWKCKFCLSNNHASLEEGEKPTDNDLTYLIKPAPEPSQTMETETDGQSSSVIRSAKSPDELVVFCVDVSGSMCKTSEVDKQKPKSKFRHSFAFGSQPKQVKQYISRLDAVKTAVKNQIKILLDTEPNQKVSLVSFSDKVTIIGDGTRQVETVSGTILDSMEEMMELTFSTQEPIKKSSSKLLPKLNKLDAQGPTALGPGLLISTVMAAQVPGSKVIICTDGLANTGLGSLEGDADKASEFYEEVAQYAVQKGVSISLIGIKSTYCRMAELGQLATTTGGQVNIVDPCNLGKEFEKIISEKSIATEVKTKFIVHKGLYIRDEFNNSKDQSYRETVVGNVNEDTEIFFEFGIKSLKDKQETTNEQPNSLPFQIQIRYVDRQGNEALRVLTKEKPVTKKRETAEKEIDSEVIGAAAISKVCKAASKGEYTQARLASHSNQRIMSHDLRNGATNVSKVQQILEPLQQQLMQQQQEEIRMFGHTRSDSEDDETPDTTQKKSKFKKKMQARKTTVADSTAMISHSEQRNLQMFKKKTFT